MKRFMLFSLMVCAAVSFGTAQDLTSGLEAYFSFDETSGEVAKDGSGNGRDAAVRNGLPIWTAGKIGGAVEFLGTDDFVITGWKGIGGDAPRTITYWTKTDWVVDNSSGIVGWGLSTSNGTKWHTRLNQTAGNGQVGAIRTEIQGTYIIGTKVINDNQWHHIASVLPDGGFLIEDIVHYVDGEVDPMSGAGSPDVIIDTDVGDTGTEVEIGSRLQGTTNQYYFGLVDEVRIYSRALSLEEVQALFAQGDTDINHWELH